MMTASRFLRGSGGWVGARSTLRNGERVHQTQPFFATRLFSNTALSQSRRVALTRTPVSAIWTAVRTFPKRRPFATNIGLSLVVSGASDVMAQRAEGSNRLDIRRAATFSSFGMLMGVLHWHLYMTIFARLFPGAATFASLSLSQKLADKAGQWALLKQVATDLALWMPFVYFPIFYCFKTIQTNPEMDCATVPWVALQKYRETWFQDNSASLGVWIPGDIVTFIVPVWLRMPVCLSISFVWQGLLSLTKGTEA